MDWWIDCWIFVSFGCLIMFLFVNKEGYVDLMVIWIFIVWFGFLLDKKKSKCVYMIMIRYNVYVLVNSYLS